jgi:hypothetical protein
MTKPRFSKKLQSKNLSMKQHVGASCLLSKRAVDYRKKHLVRNGGLVYRPSVLGTKVTGRKRWATDTCSRYSRNTFKAEKLNHCHTNSPIAHKQLKTVSKLKLIFYTLIFRQSHPFTFNFYLQLMAGATHTTYTF